MGLLQDVADYLTSAGGWTEGTDIFAGRLPPSPPTALAVYETGGLGAAHGMGNSIAQVAAERPSVQVVSRAADYAVASALARKAWVLLNAMPARAINGTEYKWCAARQSPFGMGFDQQERALVSCNYDIIRALTTSTST